MKKVINFVIIALMLQILVLKESSAQNPTPCLTDMTQAPVDTIPNYLKSWWDSPSQSGNVAIVYVDFPDGRTPQGDQPITNQQLAMVPNKEAAGEVGIIHNGSIFTTEASKYDWNNRWDMFFTNDGSYTGSAHPDYDIDPNNIAYGSMKEYWSEVSNNKFNFVPYITHPNETDIKLKTGIINDYIDVNGTKIIKMITLPKKKFGDPDTDSYFSGFTDAVNLQGKGQDIITHTRAAIISQTSFNLQQFTNNGGVLIIVFAGGMNSFKGVGNLVSRTTVVRGRRGALTDLQSSRTDGFGITAHEYGHIEFGWGHTNSGRCDIMTAYDAHHPDSPQHPNPIFKMERNWVTPVYYDNSSSISDLPPIETANECAVITIYGKPDGIPDGLGGECYIVENRRKIGFDRKIAEAHSSFYGGLAVWHYIPRSWGLFEPSTECGNGFDRRIKFMAANGNTNLCSSPNIPEHFYAHSDQGQVNYNLFTNDTYSLQGLKTGIELRNIDQENYADPNSEMSFDLDYTISEPPVYDYIVYNRGNTSNEEIILYGNVLFFGNNLKEFYSVLPGTILESYKGIGVKGIEAGGTVNDPIIARGVGYENSNERHRVKTGPFTVNQPGVFQSVNEVIFKNFHSYDVNINNQDIVIASNSSSILPVTLENIHVDNTSLEGHHDIELINTEISSINIENVNLYLFGHSATPIKNLGDIIVNGGRVITRGNIQSDILSSFNLTDSYLTNKDIYSANYPPAIFEEQPGDFIWPGIVMTGGTLDFNGVEINNADYGISSSHAVKFDLVNSEFNNGGSYDVFMTWPNVSRGEVLIKDNVFNPNTNTQTASISVTEPYCPVEISGNTLDGISLNGIYLSNAIDVEVKDNIIIGGNGDGFSTGIFSYFSNGTYSCNDISNCNDYGVLLDNSQPVMLNNKLHGNGIGLYLTSNSYPILAPAFTQSETFVIGGYNEIINNADAEIYCNNTDNSTAVPYLYEGANTIFDENGGDPNYYIYNKEPNFVEPPYISAEYNYWGGGSPVNNLYPLYSFGYDPYLTEQGFVECNPFTESENNSSESSELLMLGNALQQEYLGNYSSAINYYNQLSGTNASINPIMSLNGLYSATYKNEGDMLELENQFQTLASQNQNDTLFYRRALNLAIETKVIRNSLDSALMAYDDIIDNSSIDEEVFYAMVNKNRVIRLILDSLMSQEGDVMSNTIVDLQKQALNLSNTRSVKIDNSKRSDKGSGNNTIDKLSVIREKIYSNLNNFSELNDQQKFNLMLEKSLFDLLERNVRYDIKTKTGNSENRTTTEIPFVYELQQNYPNPFNPTTRIKYSIAKDNLVKIKIYDITGREMMTLINTHQTPGNYEVEFDGSSLSSGVYFYKIIAGSFIETKKMMLIK